MGEKVVVVHGKLTPFEVALVVCDSPHRGMVGVGEEGDRAAVVDEEGAVGFDDASCRRIRAVALVSSMDGAMRVLDSGTVEQLHGALILRQLPLGGVAQHLDALPHFTGAGGGESAAVNDELGTRLDDDF